MSDELNQNAGAQGDTGNAGSDAGQGGGTPPQTSWLDSLPDDLKGHADLKDFKDPVEVAKAFLDTKGKLPITPENPDAYTLQIPEGVPVDETFVKSAKTWAHAAGLTDAQFGAFAKSYMEMQAAMQNELNKAEKDGVDSLKAEWMGRFDENVQKIELAVKRFGGDELSGLLTRTGLMKHPAIAKAFLKIADSISEDKLIEGDGAHGQQLKYTPSGYPMLSSYDDMPRK